MGDCSKTYLRILTILDSKDSVNYPELLKLITDTKIKGCDDPYFKRALGRMDSFSRYKFQKDFTQLNKYDEIRKTVNMLDSVLYCGCFYSLSFKDTVLYSLKLH